MGPRLRGDDEFECIVVDGVQTVRDHKRLQPAPLFIPDSSGRRPGSSAFPQTDARKPSHWIPAFAGMTRHKDLKLNARLRLFRTVVRLRGKPCWASPGCMGPRLCGDDESDLIFVLAVEQPAPLFIPERADPTPNPFRVHWRSLAAPQVTRTPQRLTGIKSRRGAEADPRTRKSPALETGPGLVLAPQ